MKPYKGIGMKGPIAHWYARNTINLQSQFVAYAGRIAALLAPGARVLEVAPGPGYFAVELARLGDYRITGLDISPTLVAIARRNAARAGLSIDFRHGDASAMPFEEAEFDFVFCSAAFKNFTQPVRALAEIHRVLKPDARALIVDLRRDAPLPEIDAAVSKMQLSALNSLITRLTFRHLLLKRAYTRPEILRMAEAVPFSSVCVEEMGIGMEIWLDR
jgi:ubiquinone/menaquinone biosynthesis C-methylase UbiE